MDEPERSWSPEFEEAVRRLMVTVDGNIIRTGVHLTGVGGGEDSPPFTYTAGLAEKNLPEVIVYTLPFEVAAHILNELVARAIAVRSLRPGKRKNVANLPCWLIETFDNTPLSVARNRLLTLGLSPTFTALQLVWPDKAGLFPWDPSYDHLGCPQRLLGPGPDLSAGRR